jgi:hypothetical protein
MNRYSHAPHDSLHVDEILLHQRLDSWVLDLDDDLFPRRSQHSTVHLWTHQCRMHSSVSTNDVHRNIHARVCVSTNACAYTHTHTHTMHANTLPCTQTRCHARARRHMHTHTHVWARVCLRACVHINEHGHSKCARMRTHLCNRRRTKRHGIKVEKQLAAAPPQLGLDRGHDLFNVVWRHLVLQL